MATISKQKKSAVRNLPYVFVQNAGYVGERDVKSFDCYALEG